MRLTIFNRSVLSNVKKKPYLCNPFTTILDGVMVDVLVMKKNKIGIIGSGSWATAIVKIILEKAGQEVNWWVRNAEVRHGLETEGRNPRHLPELSLDKSRIHLSADLAEVVDASQQLYLAIPSAYLGDTLETIPLETYRGKQFVSAIKGMLPRRKMRVSQYVEQTLGAKADDVCVVSGPSHAEEVATELPTFLTVASRSRALYDEVEQALSCHYIHTSHTTDIEGVEFCGLGKNIYAIAAGICQGLDYGDNLNAVLTAAAFREMKSVLEWARPDSCRDMSLPCYLGDLMVTCWSRHSRNRRLGELVARGSSVSEAFASMGAVAEGYYSVLNLHEVAHAVNFDVPIADAVYRILYEQADPRAEIEHLIDNAF